MMNTRRDKIKLIHVLKAKLSLSDDEYRALLVSYGVDSSVEMTEPQLSDLVKKLESMARRNGIWQTKSRAIKAPDSRPRWMASRDQLILIETLWAKVSRQTNADDRQRALQNFIFHRWKYGGLEMIAKKDVSKIINAIEAMIRQSKSKEVSDDNGSSHQDLS